MSDSRCSERNYRESRISLCRDAQQRKHRSEAVSISNVAFTCYRNISPFRCRLSESNRYPISKQNNHYNLLCAPPEKFAYPDYVQANRHRHGTARRHFAKERRWRWTVHLVFRKWGNFDCTLDSQRRSA